MGHSLRVSQQTSVGRSSFAPLWPEVGHCSPDSDWMTSTKNDMGWKRAAFAITQSAFMLTIRQSQQLYLLH